MLSRRAFVARSAIVLTGAPAVLTGCCTQGPKSAAPRAQLTSIGLACALSAAPRVHEAGGDHVEESVGRFLMPDKPDAAFDAMLAEARAAQIPVTVCNSFIPGRLKSVGPDAAHDAVLSWSERAFKRAERAGVKTIVFGSGDSRRVPNNFDHGRAADQFVELLSRMGPVAERYGVVVAVEPLRPQEVNFINRIGEGAAIVRRVNHPSIRLTADLYHMLQGGDKPDAILGAAGLIHHTHIAENRGRSTPGVHGEDFRPLLRALKAIGYIGPMSIEGKWRGEELARGFQVVREQWAAA